MADGVGGARRSRWFGTVRVRTTLAVTLLFALTLSVASVAFVHQLRERLVDGIHASDRDALTALAADLQAATDLPSVLPAPAARPNAQLQAVTPDGQVAAATAGLAHKPPLLPADRRRLPGAPPNALPNALPNAPPNALPNAPPDTPPGAPPPTGVSGPPARDGAPFVPGSAAASVPAAPSGSVPPGVRTPRAAAAGSGIGERPLPPPIDIVQQVVAGSELPGQPSPGSQWALTSVEVLTPSGPLALIAASPLDDVQAGIDSVAQGLAVAIPLLVVLIAGTAWLITGRALRPVHAITAQADRITGTNLHERVPVPGGDDEITHLARTVNGMLGRIEQASERQRQFVSDASHELRSPVASIRTEVEVAMAHPERADWQAVARNVLTDDGRLDRIVTDLLLLARLDERPGGAGAAVDVDLDEVVRAEAARARGLPVDLAGVAPAKVAGRPDELARLVGHLLDNAARHGRRRVAVALVAGADGRVHLLVDDDGPGVPVEDRAAVFERFGRLEAARSRDTGGAGLGLAVVRRIAEAHAGTVTVADAPLGGARFEVVLPTAPVAAT
jgi:signal transduction histidine kinase